MNEMSKYTCGSNSNHHHCQCLQMVKTHYIMFKTHWVRNEMGPGIEMQLIELEDGERTKTRRAASEIDGQ